MVSRTPRHYSGTQSPSKKLSDLLPDFVKELHKNREAPREEIFHFWQELIGEKMAPLTEVTSFFDGVLTVKVKSTTLYSLLQGHEKARLLAQLQKKFAIRNLVFRVG
jgi:hypothetical protein